MRQKRAEGVGGVSGDGQELHSPAEAARMLAMTPQGIGGWLKKAPSDTWMMSGGRRMLKWPQFPVWVRQQLQTSRSKPTTLDEARIRHVTAQAEISELELARLRGELLTVADLEAIVGKDYSALRGKLQALTGRLAPVVVGTKSVADGTARIAPLVRELMEELSR